jgi:nucleoside-diphosphate-sugar epimerase
MRIFLTGSSGFIGSAIVQELLSAGHQVLGLARSDSSAQKLASVGAEAHRGSLEDLESLKRGAAASDGVIHTAFVHDFSALAAAGQTDLRAIEALGDALAGSGRPLVVTSAMGHCAQGRVVTEDDLPDPNSPVKHRIASEAATLALAARGVTSSLIRLPFSVHGDGDYGFIPALIRVARQKGVSAYIGEGSNRWPAVHRLDAARAFRLALERGTAGSTFHAVAEDGVPTRAIAEIISRRLQLPLVAKSATEAGAHFGWLGHFIAMDVIASSTRTRQQLGWEPEQRGLISDLEQGRYFEQEAK